jgi:hypothetical protein
MPIVSAALPRRVSALQGSGKMRRLSTFIFGMVVGGLLIYLALNYHLIHAKDGIHLVPKTSATLAATYVDVRNFGPADWANHQGVAMAILKANRGELLESVTGETLLNGLDRILSAPTND